MGSNKKRRTQKACFPSRGPSAALQRLAMNLVGSPPRALMWCACGGHVTPVLFHHGLQAEVVGIACLNCHKFLSVCVGILDDNPARGRIGSPS